MSEKKDMMRADATNVENAVYRKENKNVGSPASANQTEMVLEACRAAHQPVCLIGEPGVGKTALIQCYAESHELGAPVCLIGSQMEPQDLIGLPMQGHDSVDGQEVAITRYGIPYWQAEIMKQKTKVLFFDEFSNSPASVQASMLRLIGERRFGDGSKLPNDVFIVLAMNPSNSAADYCGISEPMANRITFITYRPTGEEVCDGLRGGWYNQEEKSRWGVAEKAWRETIASFLEETNFFYVICKDKDSCCSSPVSAMPYLASSDFATRELVQMAWASPRSWDNLAKVLGQISVPNTQMSTLEMMVAVGTVGAAAAARLNIYLKGGQDTKFDICDMIKRPQEYCWDDYSNMEQVFAIKNALAKKMKECNGKNGDPTPEELMKFVTHVISQGGNDYLSSILYGADNVLVFLRNSCPEEIELLEWQKQLMDLSAWIAKERMEAAL